MALWLVRGGAHGEHEQKFLDESRVYLTWKDLKRDLSKLSTKDEMRNLLTEVYPSASAAKVSNNCGQIWAFSHRIQLGDWIVLPSKYKPAVHVGEVMGSYKFDTTSVDPYYHWLDTKWIATDVPRSNFGQDLLYSFGAFMTVCQIRRNDAEARVRAMQKQGWGQADPVAVQTVDEEADVEDTGETATDLEQAARDLIAKHLASKFKGHGMARLVDAVLRAQGYTTHLSPPGPDKGVDILAAPGPLGFGQPRLCVQVKSGDNALDRPTLDQLIGVMQNMQADQGLLISWGGFKTSVDKEKANQFFRVRLWDQDTLIDQLLAHYEQLDEELRAELPLKRIWTLTEGSEE